MAYKSVLDDIIFIEGDFPGAQIMKKVKVDLGGCFGAQLKNLTDVKKALALKVKSSGGNCLLNFEYGQKSRWLAIDDVAFWGSGKIAIVSDGDYTEIIGTIKK
jgi:hypothetical protein